jgi:hypothetical protein
MKYLKKYLESNSIEMDEEDIDFISKLFLSLEDELMIERSYSVGYFNVSDNEYKISLLTNIYTEEKFISIIANIDLKSCPITYSEIQSLWLNFISCIETYGYELKNKDDMNLFDVRSYELGGNEKEKIIKVYLGWDIIYR